MLANQMKKSARITEQRKKAKKESENFYMWDVSVRALGLFNSYCKRIFYSKNRLTLNIIIWLSFCYIEIGTFILDRLKLWTSLSQPKSSALTILTVFSHHLLFTTGAQWRSRKEGSLYCFMNRTRICIHGILSYKDHLYNDKVLNPPKFKVLDFDKLWPKNWNVFIIFGKFTISNTQHYWFWTN